MEKLIHKHVHDYLLHNHIITCFHSDFTAGDSSVNQLVELKIPFSRPWTKAKKSVLLLVILIKPSTGSDIGVNF